MKSDDFSSMILTPDDLIERWPDLSAAIKSEGYSEGFSAGVESEKMRYNTFKQHFGDDPAFCLEAFGLNITLAAADSLLNSRLMEKLKLAEAGVVSPEPTQKILTPAQREFLDDVNREFRSAGAFPAV